MSRRRARAASAADEPGHWTDCFFRPSHAAVHRWLASFWTRHLVLTLVPCAVVWVWVAMPFPVEDPYRGKPRWKLPTHGGNGTQPAPGVPGQPGQPGQPLPTDVNFYFFLFWYVPCACARAGAGAGADGRYFGVYVAVALCFITSLFGLYRLSESRRCSLRRNRRRRRPPAAGRWPLRRRADTPDWWPQALGGKTTYLLMWALTLGVGLLSHNLDLFGMRRREHERGPAPGPGSDEAFEWERKSECATSGRARARGERGERGELAWHCGSSGIGRAAPACAVSRPAPHGSRITDHGSSVLPLTAAFWVLLSFAAMHLPALACFSKLKRDRRHVYRHAQGVVADTFFGNSLRRMPSSWLRFLWFMTCLAIASFSLIAGQAYASLFLSTLPHTSLDAGTWVWSWIISESMWSP